MSFRNRILGMLCLMSMVPMASSYALTLTGCATDTTAVARNTFFVDPLTGNDKNPGTAAAPLKNLTNVLATLVESKTSTGAIKNPGARIKAGDRIVLMPGDYGKVALVGMFNDSYIMIDGSPSANKLGQEKAVIRNLTITGGSKWAFRGIKFLADPALKPANEADALVRVNGTGYAGPTTDIIFTRNSFTSQEDVSKWTKQDWVSKNFGGMRSAATCFAAHQNEFYHLRNALNITGNKTFVLQNNIHDFGNDALEFVGSDILIRENKISNGHHSALDPLHSDGMQGFPAAVTSKNITIDANTITNVSTDPDNYLQGIDAFDGTWENIRITNNVVITNAFHGITFYGAKNITVLNNTVLASGDPVKLGTWINIAPAKDGTASENILVRNNIATALSTVTGKNVVEDHNIAFQSINLAGKYLSKEGVYADGNRIVKSEASVFQAANRILGIYDLHLKSGSPAIKASGSVVGLQMNWDHDNVSRKAGVDLGAYQSTF